MRTVLSVSTAPVLAPPCRGAWLRAHAGLLVQLGAAVPQVDLVGDITIDGGHAVEKGDAGTRRGVKQVVGLDEHGGEAQLVARVGPEE